MIKKLSFLIVICFYLNKVNAQSFYDINTVQLIEIQFSYPNWDYMMDTAKAGAGGYIMADWVRINGTQFDTVGVKYKGNSSYNPNKVKNPLHIELDHFNDYHIYDGITDIKLNNGFKDPTFVRETIAYFIARSYMSAPLANYARLYINSDYIGLYTNVESITRKFVNKHFFSKSNAFFKCNPVYTTNGKSNLVYLGADSTLYFNSYELKSDIGWQDLIELCDILKFNPNNMNYVLDIDKVLWMHAFNNLLVNLDSYLGAICQNYYLYKADNGSFNTVVWDLNEAFGCFNNAGVGTPLNLTQMQHLSPWLHLNNTERPLLQRILNIPLYKRMYMAHYKTMFNDFFLNNYYLHLADSFQNIIDTFVLSDIHKMYTYNDFHNNINQSVAGMGMIPGITELMVPRKNYLQNHPDWQHQQPAISNVHCADSLVSFNDTVTIRAQVADALIVYLGYRYSKFDRFTRTQMYDDGLHNDLGAGDGIYAIQIPLLSHTLEYYVYAENANAGMFSPEKAEFEFYSLNTNTGLLSYGDVVINEFMAINNSTIADASGNFGDWIELYNNTSQTLVLDGVFMSDNFNQPYKWQFPTGTTIDANGYLLLWADNASFPNELHASFKLSGSGERLIISYDNGYVVDSVSFGVQTSDISYGRYPNGIGSFSFMSPTPLATNSPLSVRDNLILSRFKIYPNPTTGLFFIEGEALEISSFIITDVHGRSVLSVDKIHAAKYLCDASFLPTGIYNILINRIYPVKLIKLR